jgi:2-desacetyl-2-hydroxyethyl bacteriochlorophyllide A dehydrogenase
MKAVVKTRRGIGNIELLDVDVPKIGSDDVLIEVKAAGICGTDIYIYHDRHPYNPPVILGHEFSGVIVKTGKCVKGLNVGDRVTSETHAYMCDHCFYCRSGRYNLCPNRLGFGYGTDGAFTKYVKVPAKIIHKLPENLSFEEGTLTEPLCVVTHAIIERGDIKAGDVVLITGPGPIGILAVQVAKLYSPSHLLITGLSRHEHRLKLAEKLGADRGIDTERQDLTEIVRSLTDGLGADVVIEASGAQAALNQALNVVRRDGHVILIGLYGAPIQIDLDKAVMHQLRLTGIYSHVWSTWERALKLLSSEKVRTKPLISHEFPITRWEEAFKLKISKDPKAIKILLRPID